MQPSHGIGDLNFAPARLGSDRLQYAYPWKDLVDKGLKILGGSDAPVELGDPELNSMLRLRESDWMERRVTAGTLSWQSLEKQHLRCLRYGPPTAPFRIIFAGPSRSVDADFTVFDRDLMTVPADDILNAKVVMTIVGGKIAYDGRSEPES